jgi:hypothetical protein
MQSEVQLQSIKLPIERQTFSRGTSLFSPSVRPATSLFGRSNFFHYEPTDPGFLEKYWLAGTNHDLQDKRMKEEVFVNLREWSMAKQRIDEELSNKYERVVFASDPTKISVLSRSEPFKQHTQAETLQERPQKVQLQKMFRTEEEFLDSDEPSIASDSKEEPEE